MLLRPVFMGPAAHCAVSKCNKLEQKKSCFYGKNGHEPGAIGSVSNFNSQTLTSILKLKTWTGAMIIYFNKKKVAGITIFTRFKGNNDWKELVSTKTPPYIDSHPLAETGKPETMEYMARCYNDFKEYRQENDISRPTPSTCQNATIYRLASPIIINPFPFSSNSLPCPCPPR